MARNVPEFLRRAIRLAIAAGIACCIGFSLLHPLGGWHSRWGSQTMMGTKWAAITCVVINHPVISKTGEAAVERVLGTVAGGTLGYLLAIFNDAQTIVPEPIITVPAVAGVAFASVLLGAKLQLDYAGRLFIMTFVLVAMAAPTKEAAFAVAVTRISGIIFGVIMSTILSVIIFPKSASHQATDNLKAGLSALAKLNSVVWKNHGTSEVHVMEPIKYQRRRRSTADSEADLHDRCAIEPEDRSIHQSLLNKSIDNCCDGVLTEIYARMSKCQEFTGMSRSETYVYTNRGRWCFFPAFKCFPWRSALPTKEMYQVTESARKVARLLWCLHASLPDEDDIRALGHYWGADEFLESLGSSLQVYLENVAACFPGQSVLECAELFTFIEGVETLISASHRATQDSTILLQASYGHHRHSEQGFAYDSDNDESPSESPSRNEQAVISESPQPQQQSGHQNGFFESPGEANSWINGKPGLHVNGVKPKISQLSSHASIPESPATESEDDIIQHGDHVSIDVQISSPPSRRAINIPQLKRRQSIAGTLRTAQSQPLDSLSSHNIAYIVDKDSVTRVGGPKLGSRISGTGNEGELFSPVSEILMEEASSRAVRKAASGAGKTLQRSANQKAKSDKQTYYSQVQWQATQFLLQRLTKEVAFLNMAFISLSVLLPPSRWEGKSRRRAQAGQPEGVNEPLLNGDANI